MFTADVRDGRIEIEVAASAGGSLSGAGRDGVTVPPDRRLLPFERRLLAGGVFRLRLRRSRRQARFSRRVARPDVVSLLQRRSTI